MVVATTEPRVRKVTYARPSNTTSTLAAATNREYFYDYANQDPINGYDLSGDCWFCSDPLGLVSDAKTVYHGVGGGIHWIGHETRKAWPYIESGAKWGLVGAIGGFVYGCALGGLSAIELGPGAFGVCIISGGAGAVIGFHGGVEYGIESVYDRRHRHQHVLH